MTKEGSLNSYVKLFFVLTFAVILLYIVAYSIQNFLVASSQPTTITPALIVNSGVYLSYGGQSVLWNSGTYGACYITPTFTNCLQLTTTPAYSFGFILLSIVAIFFFIILLLIFAKKAQEA